MGVQMQADPKSNIIVGFKEDSSRRIFRAFKQ
jgi:hypothetical protein